MATSSEVFVFKGHAGQFTAEKIISSGKFFSGIIREDVTINSWVEFNLVNKEKMKYILDDIDFNEEVKIEIFAYVEYPKVVQQFGNWH